MITKIDLNNLPGLLSFKEQQAANTQLERQRCIDMGMTELSIPELHEALEILGFKLDNSCSFKYYNTGNEIHYHAYSCSIIDIKRKISFAHCDFGIVADEHNRRVELQKLRRSHFGWDGKNIWDL